MGNVGSAVAAYYTQPGGYPQYGFTTFHYYGNQHWAQFGREGTACGPAAVTTAARFQRGRNLGALELERAVNNLGPAGTNYDGIAQMLGALGVRYYNEWVYWDSAEVQSYVGGIRRKLQEHGHPVIVLVDWGSQRPFDWSSWGAHYMVAFAASDDFIYFTNIGRVSNGQSQNVGYSNEQLHRLFTGSLVGAGGFWSVTQGYRLLCIER